MQISSPFFPGPILLFILISFFLFSSSINLANGGVPATFVGRQHRISKRYVLNAQRWKHCRLTWAFRDPFRLFPSEEQFARTKRVIAEAMAQWAKAARHLRFTDLSPASRSSLLNARRVADIDIFFAGFGHNDAEDFDGRGGLVAHSAYPPLGIVHFDASELWALEPKNEEKAEDDGRGGGGGQSVAVPTGTDEEEAQPLDLRYVALHEIGHALGLRHSTYQKSVMNPYYKSRANGQVIRQLSRDDRAALEELFGEICGA